MTKSLLCAVLVAELGCWSTSGPEASEPAPAILTPAPRSRGTCTELLVTCREGNNLVWTVTNRTSVSRWAFVAPPAGPVGARGRANAAVHAEQGHVVLTKIEFPPIDGERVFTGVVSLAPGESDRGVVSVGERLNPSAANVTGVRVIGTAWVISVELEIGFAEQRPADRPHPIGGPDLVVVLPGFDRMRQEIVRAPAVPWR